MLGIMQGRLSEKNEGHYQSHPTHWWQKEFRIAKKMQFDCIEFIIDKQSAVTNPLLTEKGVLEIQNVIKETGVVVKSICADIFMDEPLNHTNGHIIDARLQLLDKLIEAADKINAGIIVLPFVDQTGLIGVDTEQLVANLMEKGMESSEKGIKLALETDLPPREFRKLLDKFPEGAIFVNYDIGNSAGLGYDFEEEMENYGRLIADIHIKDRLLGGSSVLLGEGNANIRDALAYFKKNFQDVPLIMQAYRSDDAIESLNPQLDLVRQILKAT